jgi:hypothetical protein
VQNPKVKTSQIVAAIFQTLQALQKDSPSCPVSDVGDDAAYRNNPHLIPKFGYLELNDTS